MRFQKGESIQKMGEKSPFLTFPGYFIQKKFQKEIKYFNYQNIIKLIIKNSLSINYLQISETLKKPDIFFKKKFLLHLLFVK